MKRSHPYASLQLSTLIHATEDSARVVEACRRLLPQELRETLVFTQHKLQGHHHNPIIRVEATLRDSATIKAILEAIARQLHPRDRHELIRGLHRYLDEKGTLYLRLNKQAAYHGQLRFSRADPIRVKITLRQSIKHLGDVEQIYPGLLAHDSDQ